MSQERVHYAPPKEGNSHVSSEEAAEMLDEASERQAAEERERAQELGAEALELMDEIDLVLEENALEFVNAFVQGGGE